MEQKVVEIACLLKQGDKIKSIIMDNYDKLIYYFSKTLINDLNCLNNEDFMLINDELVKIIFRKMKKEEKLNIEEVNILICTIYFDAINYLELDCNEIKMKCIYPDEKRLKSSCHGVYKRLKNKGYIYYNKYTMDKICETPNLEKRLIFMLVVAHEVVHAKQFKDLLNEDISLNSYIISLEEVVRKHFKYYENNYHFTKLEVDANVRGIDILIEFFNKHKILNENMLVKVSELLIALSNEMCSGFSKHRIRYDEKKFNIGPYLLLKTTDILASSKELIEKYPLLAISHYSSGALKDYDRLLIEREKIKEWLIVDDEDDYQKIKTEIENIYDYLFECYDYGNTKLDTMHHGVKVLRLLK